MKYVVFILLVMMWAGKADAEKVFVNKALPMYIGDVLTDDFVATVSFDRLQKSVDVRKVDKASLPGYKLLKKIINSASNKSKLKAVVEEAGHKGIRQEDFDLIYNGTSWMRLASSIQVMGISKLGQYVFYIIQADDEIKVISLQKDNSGFRIPALASDDYANLIPSYVLINSLKTKADLVGMAQPKKNVCVLKNLDKSCNLFVKTDINLLQKSSLNSKDKLISYMSTASRAIEEKENLEKFFSKAYVGANKSGTLKSLSTLDPIGYIEFENSLVAYFGTINNGKVSISKLVEFSKSSGQLYLESGSKFNLVDSALSDPRFINTIFNR